MADCRKCAKKFPIITMRNARYPNPLGGGHLCSVCYQPYLFALETYTNNVNNAETDPKAAAWTALCCLLAAQRINLVHRFVAVLCNIVETKNSWEVCKQKSIELAKHAISMLDSDAKGQIFVQALLKEAERVVEPPRRQVPIQKYGSVFGDAIVAIELEAMKRSGVSKDELETLVKSLPGHEWLLPP
jgi:hypothetical protein